MRLASGSDPVNYTMWRCTHCTGYPFTWKGPADPVFVDWFQKRYNFETLQSPKWMFLWLSCFWHMMILNEMLNAGWEKLLLISNLSQFRFFFQHDIWEKLLYPKIREFLHKHRKAETWWTPWDPATIPCCCARLQTHSLCPDDSSDHLAVNLEDLSLPPDPCLFQMSMPTLPITGLKHRTFSWRPIGFEPGWNKTFWSNIFDNQSDIFWHKNGSNIWIT